MKEYVVRDESARVVTVAPLRLAVRFLKHECRDGEYSLEGPGVDCTITRKGGVLYPSSGVLNGVRFDPRNREECQRFFGGV
jgi:hypothetical protein